MYICTFDWYSSMVSSKSWSLSIVCVWICANCFCNSETCNMCDDILGELREWLILQYKPAVLLVVAGQLLQSTDSQVSANTNLKIVEFVNSLPQLSFFGFLLILLVYWTAWIAGPIKQKTWSWVLKTKGIYTLQLAVIESVVSLVNPSQCSLFQ